MTNAKNQLPGKLLIIDDEEDLRYVLKIILQDTVSEIELAADGAQGIEMLSTKHFDAILSDEKMPKKSGLEVLRWMKEQNLDTPFILNTGFGYKEMIDEAHRLGVFAFIEKPWKEGELIKTVEGALKLGISQHK